MKTRHRLFAALLTLATLLVSGMAAAQEAAGAAAAGGTSIGDIVKSFGFGFLASLTPCVYPMIMITVSIFGAQEAQSRLKAAALSGSFVLGIVCLFAPLGVASALSGKLLGSALANPWVVGVISAIFLALAASMFGAFEMALPSSLSNKLNSVGGIGFKGAFVLGLVCALVAAPCTGPGLTAIALDIAKNRDIAIGTLRMVLFALGLGIPFFVVGTFAVSLPKGGAWMLGVKWVFGVVLSYMALAYVRDISPTLQGIVSRGAAFALVAGGVLMVGLILAGIHVAAERRRSPIAHLSKPMKLASILPAVAGVFMLFSWYQLPAVEASEESVASAGGTAAPAAPAIKWNTNEAETRTKALAEKKPVLVDFGAQWCKACKEFEEITFPNSKVRAEAARFSAIKVDATDDEAPGLQELQKKYGVLGLPTVVLIDSNGKEAARFNGFVPPDQFAAALKKVN